MEHKVLSQLQVIEGMVQERIPNWNQTQRFWEQGCAWVPRDNTTPTQQKKAMWN